MSSVKLVWKDKDIKINFTLSKFVYRLSIIFLQRNRLNSRIILTKHFIFFYLFILVNNSSFLNGNKTIKKKFKRENHLIVY